MTDADPEPGIALTLATERARDDQRPPLRARVRHSGRLTIEPIDGARRRFASVARDTSRPLVLDFAPSAERYVGIAIRGKPSRFTSGQRPHRRPGERDCDRRKHRRDRVSRRRLAAQSQSGFPLHDLRARAGAPGVSLLRSTRSQGAVHARGSTFPPTGRQLRTVPRRRAHRRPATR